MTAWDLLRASSSAVEGGTAWDLANSITGGGSTTPGNIVAPFRVMSLDAVVKDSNIVASSEVATFNISYDTNLISIDIETGAISVDINTKDYTVNVTI